MLAALVTGAVLYVALGGALDRMSRTVVRADELAAQASRLRAALLDQQTGLRGYVLTGIDSYLQPYRLGLRAQEGAVTALLRYADHGQLQAAAREVDVAAQEWRAQRALTQIALVESGGLEAAQAQVASSGGLQFDVVRGALSRVDLAIRDIRQAAIGDMDATRLLLNGVIGGAVLFYGLVLIAGGWWAFRRVAVPLDELVTTAEALERGEPVRFIARRDDEIGQLAVTLERLQGTVQQRYESAAALAARSTIFNRLSELVSYAEDEDAVIRAGVAAFERLVPHRGGEVLLVNPSFDQLRVHSAWGEVDAVIDHQMLVDRPNACPGIRRNAVHITRSALDAFSLTCQIHPLRSGSLLCVPMISHNEVLGVVHLERADEDAFGEEDTHSAGRIAEQVGLALANLRLMHRMERQAMTDPLTGLANPRSFDPIVERELAIARREEQPVGMIMLDLDHFKQFNDTHGHPAGDEALRAFARTLRSGLRESDVAARYGGEEFAVLLRATDLAAARVVAEKLRAAIETTPVEIGPNRFGRITASLGVAASNVHGTDRMQLMRVADAALYAAKEGGRNRVAAGPVVASDKQPAADNGAPTPLHRPAKQQGPIGRRTQRAGGSSGFDPEGEATL